MFVVIIGIGWFARKPIARQLEKFKNYRTSEAGKQFSKDLDRVIMFLSFIVALWFVYNWVDLSVLHSEITAYPVTCTVSSAGKCEGQETALPKLVFKINSDTQQVVAITEDGTLTKLPNCVVVDRTNWQCSDTENGSPTALGFKSGNFFFSDTPANTLYVSKLNYEISATH